MIKNCVTCGNDFKTYKEKQKFCSRVCSGKARKLKRVRVECGFSGCSTTFSVVDTSTYAKRFCSPECQHKWQVFNQSGDKNGNFGRENKWGHHNDEKRKEISVKIKKSWENPERLVKHLEFLDRHRLPDGSFDFQDKSFREKLSIAAINRLIKDPKYGAYTNCKKGWYISEKTKDNEYYHSSWEELKMKELDCDDDVVFWTKKHGYIIKYEYNNTIKRYLPDFLVRKKNTITMVEVKGYVKDVELYKAKTLSALYFFHKINIDYVVDFMKNTSKYNELIEWFNKEKGVIYGYKN